MTRRLHWIAVACALLLGGWLPFDGGRALVEGDYVTPSSGEHAGRLGPWAAVVESVGLAPRSTLVKSIHLVLGVAWLFAVAAFVRRHPLGRTGLLACAVLSLWYLPFGTLLSVAVIGLLLGPARTGE